VRIAGQAVRPLVLDIGFADEPAMHVKTDWHPGERIWRGMIDGAPVLAQLRREGHSLRVERRGVSALARLLTPRVAELAALMPEKAEAGRSNAVLCPMPGLVVSIAVREGQAVEAGESLAVVEAMKMENVLRAGRAGKIARILVKPGDSLAVDSVIMEFA
jgi:propionyl-CoA carboxylase alpha chain